MALENPITASVVEACDIMTTNVVREYRLATEIISLAAYDASLGNLKKLEEAANMFKTYPSAIAKDGPLRKLLDYGKVGQEANFGTARGAAYELEKAYDLTKAGEEVIEFGKKIAGKDSMREFDIVTKSKLIECKNLDWSKKVGDVAGKMKSNICEQQKIAKEIGKAFELHSKTKVPSEWRRWFESKGIRLIEG